MKPKENKLKQLSSIISLICNIFKIVLKVMIPFIIITMILSFYIISNIKVEDSKIHFKTNNIKLTDENDIKIYDVTVIGIDDSLTVNEITNIFDKNSNFKITIYIEFGLIFLLVNVILMIILLTYIQKLFDNIKNNNTPFIKENINNIKKISYLTIGVIMISPVSGALFNYILGLESQDNMFDIINVLEILIIYAMSYVFEYGYNIEKNKKEVQNGR